LPGLGWGANPGYFCFLIYFSITLPLSHSGYTIFEIFWQIIMKEEMPIMTPFIQKNDPNLGFKENRQILAENRLRI
jgi:hypothetical protein